MQQRERIVLFLKLYLCTFSEEKKKKVILIAISFYPGFSSSKSKDSFSNYVLCPSLPNLFWILKYFEDQVLIKKKNNSTLNAVIE